MRNIARESMLQQRKQVYIEINVHQLKKAFGLLAKIMKQNLKSRQPLIPEFFLERVLKGGGGCGEGT